MTIQNTVKVKKKKNKQRTPKTGNGLIQMIKDGRVTCNFTSFSIVFQSYQDDWRVIMKSCVQWNPVYGREDFASRGVGGASNSY